MSKIKILHVITTFDVGGAEKAVMTLAIKQAAKGHQVKIVPLKGISELSSEVKDSGVEVDESAMNLIPLQQILILKKLIKDFDVIHAHLPRAELLSRIAFGKGMFISTRHNSERFFPSIPPLFSALLSRWVTNGSLVISISNAVQTFLENSKELHFSTSRIVIYYGYEPSLRGPKTSKKNYVTKDKYFHIGTISRLTPQKNIPLLIKLTQALVAKGYFIRVSIVGDGSGKSDLIRLINVAKLEKNIHFLGKVRNVESFLNNLDLFVLTSIYEGFGLVLLEAMDAKVPIIAANNSSIPEVLGKEHPGLFTSGSLESLVEKAQQLMDSQLLRNTVLVHQELRVDLFPISTYVSSHEYAYDNFLSRVKSKVESV